MPSTSADYEVCIVGAGIAGLSAALVLARCAWRVIVFDSGKPRNYASRGLHAFLSRDGTNPLHLRELGRKDVAQYPNVEIRDIEVVAASPNERGFGIRLRDDAQVHARALLLATGRFDVLPGKPGFRELYGRGVYHCPVCDAWEHRDQPLVLLGRGDAAAERALGLLRWSRRVTLCSDGPCALSDTARAALQRNGVAIDEAEIALAVGNERGHLTGLRFADGRAAGCEAVFFDTACPQKSPLAEALGCALDETGAVVCRGPRAANVPGLFVAGNVRCGIHLAITAAAEGAEAAIAINELLAGQDLA